MAAERILVVDDEGGVRRSLTGVLEDEGFQVDSVDSGEACLERLQGEDYDAVLLDVWLPGIDGLETLERMPEPVRHSVVLISGHGSVESAVRGTKLGAFDFMEKPLSLERVVLAVKNAARQRRLERRNLELSEQLRKDYRLVGESPAIRKLRAEIETAAPSHGRVLITGENGTGKELVARLIHAESLRSDESFVEVNCAAIPEELIESEMFGHVRGSFTGAVQDKKGKFHVADGGTLFLDEVGDMSPKTQARVLRVLQEQKVQPVGSADTFAVDVRVLAATNKDLEDEIRQGRFREDLYFRLNVIPIRVPALRDRRSDVPLLVEHFLDETRSEYGRRPKEIDDGALGVLMDYRWPGNVRELKNVVERLVIMVPDERIQAEHIRGTLRGVGGGAVDLFDSIGSLRSAREEFERRFILRKLEKNGWNVAATARELQIERSHLHRKMKSYGIRPGMSSAE